MPNFKRESDKIITIDASHCLRKEHDEAASTIYKTMLEWVLWINNVFFIYLFIFFYEKCYILKLKTFSQISYIA